MPDWVERVAARFSLERSRLFFVADPDGLLGAARLREALLAAGLELVGYGDPVAFRCRYEAELRPRLLAGDGPGALVAVGTLPESAVPYDLLGVGVYIGLSLRDAFPKLSAAALADVPHDDLDRVDAAYARYTDGELGERGTRDFLLERVYGVSPRATSGREDFVAYLMQRHYAHQTLPPSLDRLLVERLAPDVDLGDDPMSLLREPARFFDWLQKRWDRYVAAGAARELRESPAPFDAPVIRAYLDNLFAEGRLRPVRTTGLGAADWMRPGLLLPGDEPEREFREALLALDGAWPPPTARRQDWLAFAGRWAGMRALAASLPGDPTADLHALHAVQEQMQEAYRAWLLGGYDLLPTLAVTTAPVMVHQIAAVLRRAVTRGDRVALVVVDGMALEQWVAIRERVVPVGAEVTEAACFAWAPTLTSVSRQAIFAGRAPHSFPDSLTTTEREPAHWRRLGADWDLPPAAVAYHRLPLVGSDDKQLASLVADHRLRLAGLVLNDLDHLTHRASLGLAELQRNVRAWAEQGRLRRLVETLLAQGFAVYLAADHGSVEATGAGEVREGALVEQRALRARLYAEEQFLDRVLDETPHAEAWQSAFLPPSVHVAVAKGHAAFAPTGETVVAHGGIALEEMIVPFVRIGAGS